MNQQIKDFAVAFFTNLKANVSWKDQSLIVENVPPEFEKFSGKKAPYNLVFSPEHKTESSELMAKGSHLLQSMASYLDNRGQTTILKANLSTDIQHELSRLKLKNCVIGNISRNQEYRYLVRFTFQTNFQYLNEKEQLITPIIIDNGNLASINLDSLTLVEGKKEDVKLNDLEPFYIQAKEALRPLIQPKSKQISENLKIKLEKELVRIKEHYQHQNSEGTVQLSKLQRQLLEAQQAFSKDPSTQNDLKIKKINESIIKIQENSKNEQFKKEEEFFISDEIKKHSLSINNKLINTSIIYYPYFTLTVFLKNGDSGRLLELNYDPAYQTLSQINCEICKSPLDTITLCSSGHLSCPNCISLCKECGKDSCKNCLADGRLCKKCLVKCYRCNAYRKKTEIRKNPATFEVGCIYCLKKCVFCQDFSLKFKSCSICHSDICEKCLRKELALPSQMICKRCVQQCAMCGNTYTKDQFPLCKECKIPCIHNSRCLACRKTINLKNPPSRFKSR